MKQTKKFLFSITIIALLICTIITCASCNITESDTETCETIAEQAIASLLTLDYSTHFSFFQKEFFDVMVQEQMSMLGYSYDDALIKLDQTIKDSAGFSSARAELQIGNVDTSLELLTEYKEENANAFASVGLDINKVQAVRKYYFKSIRAYFNDIFYGTDEDFDDFYKSVTLYKYDGKWYVDRRYLDDDLSIDLLESDKKAGKGVAYKTKTITGTIESIEYGYVNLGGDKYFLVRDSADEFVPGIKVSIVYYDLGWYARRISDDSQARICSSASITNLESK